MAELQKENAWEHLTADDVRNIQCVDSQYFPVVRTAEHTLTCEIHGEPVKLFYEVSKHDDGEGFTIHSDGKDIWDLMPEPELRKLEPVLSQAVSFAGWQKELEQAETAAAVRDVRYGLYETEYLNMSREQISALHEAIDRKEAALTAADGPFRYYSTQRPVDIGTFPKPPDNKVVEIVNFDKRIPVENETMRAWGYIEYQKPLTEQQADDYELRPAPVNRLEKRSVLEDLKTTKTSSRDANVTRKPKKQKEETR